MAYEVTDSCAEGSKQTGYFGAYHRLSWEGPCKVLHGLQSIGLGWLRRSPPSWLFGEIPLGVRSEEATSEADGLYVCICLNLLIAIYERQWFVFYTMGNCGLVPMPLKRSVFFPPKLRFIPCTGSVC